VKTLITLSCESCQRFLEEIRRAIQLSKGKAAYQLIVILVPKIINWAIILNTLNATMYFED
jgi:hypothetical protein